jgi:D-alanyl-D-alanine carboxypeptidase
MPTQHSTAATLIALLTFFSTADAQMIQTANNSALLKCVSNEAATHNFSGVISITWPGGTLSIAQGVMSGPGSATLSANAQFNLGSAGKMFTAVAVAQLVDAKKIDLEQPIGMYVNGLTPEAAAVTIRQLLTHSSGLGNFFSPENLPFLEKARTLSGLLPLVAGEKPAFNPGSRFEYSNSGFLLLGLMIERVSGQSYEKYLKTHVFKPAGMIGSTLVPSSPAKRAAGMTTMPEMPPLPPNGPPRGISVPPPSGTFRPPAGPLRPAIEAALRGNSAGGCYSTAADMQRFFASLLSAKLTSAAMRDVLLSAQIVAMPAQDGRPARSHGLGFGVGSYSEHKWAGHNGGTLGVNVEAMTFFDDSTTVIIMANRDPPMASELMRKVQAMLFEKGACDQMNK